MKLIDGFCLCIHKELFGATEVSKFQLLRSWKKSDPASDQPNTNQTEWASQGGCVRLDISMFQLFSKSPQTTKDFTMGMFCRTQTHIWTRGLKPLLSRGAARLPGPDPTRITRARLNMPNLARLLLIPISLGLLHPPAPRAECFPWSEEAHFHK